MREVVIVDELRTPIGRGGKDNAYYKDIRADDIARAAWKLMLDKERRRDMRAAGLNTVDGKAGERIAADLVQALADTRGAKAHATAP